MAADDPSTPYSMLGGEDGVRALVDRFYDLMDSLSEAADIRALHPRDLGGSREKLFLFLSGWLGGPGLYVERYGHPMLRARHLSFPIGDRERDQWMRCMEQALTECDLPPAVHEPLVQAFARTASHMRNYQS
jgi:hemoglobin